MSVEFAHEHYVKDQRVRVLSRLLSEILPEEASVLDVGTGDGKLARSIMDLKPGVSIIGIDSLVREETTIPVKGFDGNYIP